MAETAGFDFDKEFSNFALYVKMVEKHAEIHSKKLFKEVNQLESEVKEKLLKTEEEKTLDQLLEQTRLLHQVQGQGGLKAP